MLACNKYKLEGTAFPFVSVFIFNVLGTNWGPTDRLLSMQIHLVKILLLLGKQLMTSSYAFVHT